jgi:hypothetical protein
MAKTYEPIATTTLGTQRHLLHFLLLSGTYTDLVLVASIWNYRVLEIMLHLQFNGDTGQQLF